jgi:hypothetical protein
MLCNKELDLEYFEKNLFVIYKREFYLPMARKSIQFRIDLINSK